MAKKLEQWKNTLTIQKVVEGMNAASSNAQRLLDDAKVLFDLQRYPSSTSLAILAIEEVGKISILRELALIKDGKDVKKAWNKYRSHTQKNMIWGFVDLFSNGARKLHDFASLFDNESEHPFILDHLKQIAFYSDCLGKCHWSIPVNVIDKDVAEAVIESAIPLVTTKVFTLEEIELWVKYLSPVWGGEEELVNLALKNYFCALYDKGILSKDVDISAFMDL